VTALENGRFSAMDAFESLKSYVTAAKSRSKLETVNKLKKFTVG